MENIIMITSGCINEEGKVNSITEYLSDLLFVKQLYGQEICGEKKTMEQL